MGTFVRAVFAYAFRKKIFVLFTIAVVFFSAVFTSFAFRTGEALSYGNYVSEIGYRYTFVGDVGIIDDDFYRRFEKYGFIFSQMFPADEEYEVAYGTEKFTFDAGSLCNITDERVMKQIDGYEKYFDVGDIREQNALAVVSQDLSRRLGGVPVGSEIYLNGVAYTVAGVADLYETWGSFAGDVVSVNCDEFALSASRAGITVFCEKMISDFSLKKIANETGTSVNLSQRPAYIVLFTALSFAISALFAVNIAVLFYYFVRINDKFYAIFKILGAKRLTLALAIALPCAAFALIGATAGIGADYLIASFTVLLEEKVYLGFAGTATVFAVNVFCAFAGAAIAGYLYAGMSPSEGLSRAG